MNSVNRDTRSLTLWISLLLAASVVIIYYPVGRCDFVNLDDPAYVTANPHVQGGLTRADVLWAFETRQAGYWHPLTWLSHILDAQCFGPGAAGPHWVNLGFHVANTVLLFLLLRQLSGAVWRPALVAALFGWHPLRVESVAWVAERKDLLSGFFFLLTLWAYARYVNVSKVRSPKSKVWYGLTLLGFILGLMSKPMLVTLPFVLLLMDYWPLGRSQATARSTRRTVVLHLLREKAPFLLFTVAACLVTLWTKQQRGAVQSLAEYPPGLRVENAAVSYLRYLGKTIWPAALATPYPDAGMWPLPVFGSALVLLAVLTVAALWLGRRFPFVAMGWLWFCGMLVPVIGIVQVGAQSMADRFTYLPSIGLFILLVWAGAAVLEHWRIPPTVGAVVAGLVLAACALRSRDQLRYWQNSETLLSHAIAVSHDNWIAEYNLGWALEHEGRPDEALPHYRESARIQPRDVDSLDNLGFLLAKKGNYAEALPCFENALRVKPDFFELHYNLAGALLHLQRYDEAIEHYELFLQHRPDHVAALNELGVALGTQGRLDRAMSSFREALRLRPDDPDAHYNLGEALVLQGKPAEAIPHLKEALRLRPGWTEPERELRNLNETGAGK